MADTEYRKNEDGTFSVWRLGQDKISKDRLVIQKAQLTVNVEAFSLIQNLTKEAAQVVAAIVQQQADLMKKPDFTWTEIVAKYMAPIQAQLTEIDKAIKET